MSALALATHEIVSSTDRREEPAQVAAYKAGLSPKLLDLIETTPSTDALMSYLCKLLKLVASQGESA